MATQAAARSAKDAIPKVLPAASPFSELLRRSKFASFDPEIRQTYSAPPSYIFRGNWGLKRPLANRRHNGHIVLKNFEEHAHYIEWDKADGQVRFIKRVAEMNLAPKLVSNTSWSLSLGPTSSAKESGIDSDFCHGERAVVKPPPKESTVKALSEDPPKHPPNLISVNLDTPTKGKGAYGANAQIPSTGDTGNTYLQPNIAAMTAPQFKRYISKLREMRPEFFVYLRKQLKTRWDDGMPGAIDPNRFTDEALLSQIGNALWDTRQSFHFRFLGEKSDALYHAPPEPQGLTGNQIRERAEQAVQDANKPQVIRAQPHKLAGLTYAQPTAIETYYSVKPEPGFALHSTSTHHQEGRYDKNHLHVASFAGLASTLNVMGPGAKHLFAQDVGAVAENVPSSARQMLATELRLERPPVVVGRKAPNLPLRQVVIRPKVVDMAGAEAQQNWRDNPYQPGSYEYSSLQAAAVRQSRNATHNKWGGASAARVNMGQITRTMKRDKPAPVFERKLGSEAVGEASKTKGSTLELLKTMTAETLAPRVSWLSAKATPKPKSPATQQDVGEGEQKDS